MENGNSWIKKAKELLEVEEGEIEVTLDECFAPKM